MLKSLVEGRSTTVRANLLPLTGLRGIAAYSVLIAHAMDTSFLYGGVSVFHSQASRLAYFAMSLFFVLSGFVIYYNYAEKLTKDFSFKTVYRFFVARFARLYPLYAFSILISLSYFPSPLLPDVSTTLAYFTLTQSWFNLEMAVFPPDWSISTEWFFYVAFVPLVFVLARISRPLLALGILSIVAAAGLHMLYQDPPWLTGVVAPLLPHNPKASADPWAWIVYFCPYLRFLEFVAGALAAKAYMSAIPAGRSGTARIGLALCVGWCGAVILVPAVSENWLIGNLISNFIFAPAIALLLYLCCRHETLLSRALSSRPLQFAGEISYSVYIWCWSIMTLLDHSFVSATPSPLAYLNSSFKLAVVSIVTTLLAYGSYRLIEIPTRRWIRSAAGHV